MLSNFDDAGFDMLAPGAAEKAVRDWLRARKDVPAIESIVRDEEADDQESFLMRIADEALSEAEGQAGRAVIDLLTHRAGNDAAEGGCQIAGEMFNEAATQGVGEAVAHGAGEAVAQGVGEGAMHVVGAIFDGISF